VLVDPLGHPKVIDFGGARWGEADDSMSAITATDQVIGSVASMSPEQFAGDPAV
jgi:serine/threonine protein kinase